MTYTTLRYLIVFGLLLNVFLDANGSEEPNTTGQQAEDRSPSVSPPLWFNHHVGVYNQPNLAPILRANSPKVAVDQ
ncbi:hypothetical protein FACS1894122_12790 [Alphaproteobacteria bacterium]|nr:hypothetical protein FACS1894122_12790 [Alphaproteobacteria bacterium]